MSLGSEFFHRIKRIFDHDLNDRLAHAQDIEMVLGKLSNKEKSILQALAKTDNADEIHNLRRDLDIIRAQQQKGRAVVQSLNGSKSE